MTPATKRTTVPDTFFRFLKGGCDGQAGAGEEAVEVRFIFNLF
jgi:hypothetical protein